MQEKAKEIYVETRKREDLEEKVTAPKKENRDEQALIWWLFYVKKMDRDSEMKRELDARTYHIEARERERLDILKQSQALQTEQSQLFQVNTQQKPQFRCYVCLYNVGSVLDKSDSLLFLLYFLDPFGNFYFWVAV